jgi:hypothetical protein
MEVERYVNEEDEFYESGSNSSEEEKHDEWIPIMSKMQEIRIDLNKLFESIKGYQEVIRKFEEEKEENRKK